jgi:hypothetical protein
LISNAIKAIERHERIVKCGLMIGILDGKEAVWTDQQILEALEIQDFTLETYRGSPTKLTHSDGYVSHKLGNLHIETKNTSDYIDILVRLEEVFHRRAQGGIG